MAKKDIKRRGGGGREPSSKTEGETAPTDNGQQEVQDKVDEELADGFSGVAVDPTPNKNYTVEGVTAEAGQGLPTPETDAEFEAAARKAAGIGGRFAGR
jgi:hypothetical protein